MIAYNKTWLDYLAIKSQAIRWFKAGLLAENELEKVKSHFATSFIQHHFIIRVGLFIFTYFLISACVGLVSFVFIAGIGSESVFKVLNFVYSTICFFLLDKFIKENKYFKAGIDDGLLYGGVGFLLFGIGWVLYSFDSNDPILLAIWMSLICFSVFLWCALRYLDHGMALLATASFYTFVFCVVMEMGPISKFIMPFVLFLVSVGIVLLARNLLAKSEARFYRSHLEMVKIFGWLVAYSSLNYFVVREAGIAFFDMVLPDGTDIPFAGIFYLATVVIPLVYIVLGLRKRDRDLLRTGLFLVVVAVVTIKYYYSIAPIEITLTVSGVLVFGLAYLSIRYLKSNETPFTFLADLENAGNGNAEALILAQTFAKTGAEGSDQVKFGGGSMGGGGASGSF